MKAPNTRFLLRLVLTVIYLMGIIGIVASGGGGGGGGSSDDGDAPVTAAMPTLDFDIKTFRFSWTDVGDATHYRLLENPDGLSGFSNVSANIPQGTQTFDHIVPLYKRANASYILQSCNQYGCTDSNTLFISGTLVDGIGYFKASNTDAGDFFGNSVSLSADGSTLAVGAPDEYSNATGINGDETDNSATASGAVYVFIRAGATWSQQAYVKASNTDAGDRFGRSVSLSDDGNTLAVGAPGEESSATGVNGNQASNSSPWAGATYIFVRSGTTWSQQAYVKATNTSGNDRFGSVSLSDDGDTLAVGAYYEDGLSEEDSGAVYVYKRNGATWAPQAYLKASNADIRDYFGASVSLSANGNTLAVGAHEEDSGATGINGDETDNFSMESGAVYVFTRSGALWTQQAYVKSSNIFNAGDRFGRSVSLSDDGNTLAVGAINDDNNVPNSGAVFVFTRNGATWSQQALVKASNPDQDDSLGWRISLSADGNTLAAVASREDSNATGINGDQSDNSLENTGAVYVFTRSGANWTQQAYVKPSTIELYDRVGSSISLSDDGNTLVVGADYEDSNAVGVNGDQSDNSAGEAGAAYLF